MKRVTILFDDEQLYRGLKAEAAKEGRPVKEVVAEALSDWLRRRSGVSAEVTAARLEALRLSDQLRSSMPVREGLIRDTLDEIRHPRRV
jgi:hypothetical protein